MYVWVNQILAMCIRLQSQYLSVIWFLYALVKTKKSLFVKCLSEKMMTYGLGRGLQNYDTCKVSDIVAAVAKNDSK